MYGVILWSDPDVRKAVIWCEDSGYLAYYEAPEEARSTSPEFFGAGDYVEFEMMDNLVPLRACNAQTLRSAQSPRVQHTLQAAGSVPTRTDPGKGRVVGLADRRAAVSTGINRRG